MLAETGHSLLQFAAERLAHTVAAHGWLEHVDVDGFEGQKDLHAQLQAHVEE